MYNLKALWRFGGSYGYKVKEFDLTLFCMVTWEFILGRDVLLIVDLPRYSKSCLELTCNLFKEAVVYFLYL